MPDSQTLPQSAPSVGSTTAGQFALLWRPDQDPDVGRFLAGCGPLPPREVAEVLRVDQRRRWLRGERPEAARYLSDYPIVASDPEAAVELVYAEYLVREELGESPEPSDYEGRYPELADRLALQFEVHRALGSIGPAPTRPTSAPFEVIELLGRGGMGVVYSAKDVRLDRIIALKMFRPEADIGPPELARFRAEAEALARLQHPNIVQVYEVGEIEGRPFFAMERVDGGSLERRLDGKPRPIAESARLVETLARAAHHAHERGLIHRDLKPANILMTAEGAPKIADFGLAKLLGAGGDDDDQRSGRTRTGALMGTPCYMAPEQAAGRARDAGPATDVYALGVILYELLTGLRPFRGSSPLETLEQVRTLDPVPPGRHRPALPRELDIICLKCLEKEPKRRYPDARALAEDLSRYLHGEPIAARDSGLLNKFAYVLSRGQHDREFHLWSTIILATIPIPVTAHLIVFFAALTAPAAVRAAAIIPWFVFLTLCLGYWWINRTRIHLPATAAVRQVAAMLMGYIIASILILPVCQMLKFARGPEDDLKLYAFIALMTGQLYFGLGGSYWGGCYLLGLGFIVSAPIMAINPTFAPLELAIMLAASQLTIGLHLRKLGREFAGSAQPSVSGG